MIRILFLAANPVDQARLQLRNEFNAVRQVLDAAAARDRFQLIPEFDATPSELQDLLTRHRPQIVHFSGHGTNEGLYFVNDRGRSRLVAPSTLRDLFGAFSETVRCVLLNACYSAGQAMAIAEVVDCVVGMGDAITDDAALAFAGAFYRALATGAPLITAFARARNQIDLAQLAEAHKPQLLAERIDTDVVCAFDWDDGVAAETPTASAAIQTDGGAVLQGDLNVADFVNRDKVVNNYYFGATSPAVHPAPAVLPRGMFGLYPFNEHFFGRDDELASLHALLQREPNVSICPVITGMGGLGKTQLAAHYARAHIADYPDGIFWITAADLNSIRPQLADFCVALNLSVADPQRTGDLTEQKISAFKTYVDQHPQALLILDNVAEPDHLRTRQIGIGFTMLTLGGKVLVTTRRRKLTGDHFAELPLEHLLPNPARQILTTARPDLADDPDLDRLCAQFGYLPLMLNLAAAALAKRGGRLPAICINYRNGASTPSTTALASALTITTPR